MSLAPKKEIATMNMVVVEPNTTPYVDVIRLLLQRAGCKLYWVAKIGDLIPYTLEYPSDAEALTADTWVKNARWLAGEIGKELVADKRNGYWLVDPATPPDVPVADGFTSKPMPMAPGFELHRSKLKHSVEFDLKPFAADPCPGGSVPGVLRLAEVEHAGAARNGVADMRATGRQLSVCRVGADVVVRIDDDDVEPMWMRLDAGQRKSLRRFLKDAD